MKECITCGNAYENCFEVRKDGQNYIFDCFECAIHKIAPTCEHCFCKIIGHGVQANDAFYCCAHCARACGVNQAKDNLDAK